ncbi:MAG: hypothetical protein FJZ01_14280 [Candidatus Sericytochromatia bacterium]|nr:hypothetical protein [Candidatus Tanganyikabacteria bacterium]
MRRRLSFIFMLVLLAPALAGASPAVSGAGRDAATYQERRAFPGAPPFYAHDLGPDLDLDRETCLGCHESGADGAPVVPHPGLPDCRQCHVAARTDGLFKPTDWVTPPRPPAVKAGRRTAPPAVPHAVDRLRERCVACHAGPTALAEIRTPHPERKNCLQCHLAAAEGGIRR